MREILFRGKNIDLEWVEGDLLQNGVDYKTAIRTNKEGVVERVISHTVGQYTGLTDKNGKRIFEGDIVKYDNEIRVVKYYDGYFYPFVAYPEYQCWDAEDCEVIGNIYDNPELIKT